MAKKTSFPMIIPGLFWENLVIAQEKLFSFHFSMTSFPKTQRKKVFTNIIQRSLVSSGFVPLGVGLEKLKYVLGG